MKRMELGSAIVVVSCLTAAGTTAQSPAVLKGPVWTAEGEQAGAQLGTTLATAGDVNGDGYSDVLVGAYTHESGEEREGRAYLFLGSAAGLGTTPAWTAESNVASALFGYPATTAGDVNGDGYSDVIVGAYGYSNGESNEGAAFLYLGSKAGLGTLPAWTAEGGQVGTNFGYSAATAGDVNGDGFSDVLVGAPLFSNGQQNEGRAYLYLGSAAGLASSPAWTAEDDQAFAQFGKSVAPAGDVNGDGYGDVLVGAPYYLEDEPREGAAYLYLGSPAGLSPTPAWEAEGHQRDAFLGYWVATAGDLNADGYGDVIVGAYGITDGQSSEGRAYAYLGSADGLAETPAWTVDGESPNSFLGYSVATAGDLNGDGFSDVLVGAYGYENRGRALAFLGSPTGLATTPAWTSSGQSASAFGFAVATAGDVNGDGRSDVIVGAFGHDNGQRDEGRAFLFLGSAPSLASTPAWTADGPDVQGRFGGSVAPAGDIDGDGFGDVIVGAPLLSDGEPEEGFAFVYRGTQDGLATTPIWSADGDRIGASYGASVAGAGDVNGDGFGDVIVGAPLFAGGARSEGKAFVHLGSPDGLAGLPAWTVEGEQAAAQLGSSVAGAGDVNGDGFGDVIIGASGFAGGETGEGRALLYLGSASGLAGTPAWNAESNQVLAAFARSVAGAGDVNGDGYGDVIVGAPLLDHGQADEGRAFLYPGSPVGLARVPAWTAEGERDGAFFGRSVASAGDVNGDGFSDVIVGADGFDDSHDGEGRVFVYLGSAAGLATMPAWTADGDRAGARLGVSVATAGDLNGDGYSDVIVGAPRFEGGQTDEGRALVYLGSATGLAASPAWTVEGEQAAARLGASVASAGDVNGDGYADALVGVPAFSLVEFMGTGEGRVLVHLGNGGKRGWVQEIQQRTKDGARPIALLGRTGADGLFRIRAQFPRNLASFSWASPAKPSAYLEWEVKPLGVPFDEEGIERSAVAESLVPPGGMVTFDELVKLDGGPRRQSTSFRWRARVATDNPLLPHTAWFSVPGNNITEAKLRRTKLSPP